MSTCSATSFQVHVVDSLVETGIRPVAGGAGLDGGALGGIYAGLVKTLADRAPMNAQLGTDLAQLQPWAYKSAARLTSIAPP